jgi:hypothetical protein
MLQWGNIDGLFGQGEQADLIGPGRIHESRF